MNLVDFGFPGVMDNARKKEVVYFDTQGLNSTNVIFFKNNSLGLSRNKMLPPSGQEIILINGIKANYSGSRSHIGAFLFNSYLQIVINDVTKLKIPLIEILQADGNYHTIGVGTIMKIYTPLSRIKQLENPIIVNSNSSVDVSIVLDSADSGQTIALELYCTQYDKLNDYSIDFRQDKNYEKLSYTMYDQNNLNASTGTVYSFFNDPSKAVNLFSKTFPLGESEIFIVKAIELANSFETPQYSADVNITILKKSVVEIYINETLIFTAPAFKFASLYQRLTGAFADATPVTTPLTVSEYITNVLVLNTPIIIPSKSNVIAKVTQNGALNFSNSAKNCLMLKGDLIRRVQ